MRPRWFAPDVPRSKRVFDVVAAVSGMILLLPLFAAIAAVVLAVMGRPILFRQVRAGHLGRPFVLVKFRTMTRLVAPDGSVAPDDRRLTGLGRFLRFTSLDELPELWNVLRGDMSLVGPRPLLLEYLPRYTEEQARRHDVRPGITGWAQVNGRNALDWEARFRLDVWYVEHCSFLLDVKILLLTVAAVLRRHGVTPLHGEVMEKFTGASDRARG